MEFFTFWHFVTYGSDPCITSRCIFVVAVAEDFQHEGRKASSLAGGVIFVPVCCGKRVFSCHNQIYERCILVLIRLLLSDRCTGDLPSRPRREVRRWRCWWLGGRVLPRHFQNQVWGESVEAQTLQHHAPLTGSYVFNICPWTIALQGPTSKKPLAYKWYNAEEVILGKKMKIRFVNYALSDRSC
jgi:hypothetical protein